jgi:hypothetical protein
MFRIFCKKIHDKSLSGRARRAFAWTIAGPRAEAEDPSATVFEIKRFRFAMVVCLALWR